MTIVSSLIAPIVDRTIVLRSIISRSIKNLITRHFINFDPVAQTYGEFLSPYVLPNDFEVEIDFCTGETGSAQYLVDAEQDLYFKINIHSDGFIHYLVGDGTSWICNLTGTITAPRDNKIHTVKFTKSGNDYIAKVDGITDITSTKTAPVTPHIKYVAKRSGDVSYFKGTLSNLKITDLSTPEPVTDFYPIDTLDDYELSSNTSLGEELLVGDTIAPSSIKTILPAGSYGIPVLVTGGLSAGLKYHDDVGVISFISDNQMISSREGGNGVLNLYNSTTSAVDLSHVSAKGVQGNALLLNNVDHSETELATFDEGNSRWVGENIWNDANATVFSDLGNSTFDTTNGIYHLLSFGEITGVQSLETPLVSGESYDIAYTVIGDGSGGLGVSDFINNLPVGEGVHTIRLTPSSNRNIYFKRTSSLDVTIANISVKRIIDIAPQSE